MLLRNKIGRRIKSLKLWGFTEISDFYGRFTKNQYIEGGLHQKEGGCLGQFADLRGTSQEKGGVVFEREVMPMASRLLGTAAITQISGTNSSFHVK